MTEVDSREDLIKRSAMPIRKNCKRCGVSNIFEIGNIKAKLSKRIRHVLIELAVIGATVALLVYMLAKSKAQMIIFLAMYTGLSLSYLLYTRRNMKQVHAFNKK